MTGGDQDEPVADGGAESLVDPEVGSRDGDVTATDARRAAETAMDENRELLFEAVRRHSLLRSLRSGAASGSELSKSTDVSRSTVHRAANTLEEYNLIEKSDGAYGLTRFGEIITEKTTTLAAEVSTAMALEPFLNTINMDGVPIEHFVDARVTRPTPRQPHLSIQRILELLRRSDSLRMLSTVLSPIYVDVGYREMTDGMEIEAVFEREAIDIMVSQYAEKAYETISSGNFEVYAHEGLPFELFVLDDKMGMASHDENGVARVFVECDDPAAIDWAEGIYDDHRSGAERLSTSDL